jgi:uncharacterized protein YndB with AHSA1/START domain
MNVEIDRTAPVQSAGEVTVRAPVARVWSVLARIEAWPRWQEDVTAARLLGPLGEGAEFRWKAAGIPFRSRIHTLVEGRMLGWTGRTLGVSAIHNWWFTEADGGTTVRVEESLRGLLPSLFPGFFQRNLDAGIQKSLAELGSAAEEARSG